MDNAEPQNNSVAEPPANMPAASNRIIVKVSWLLGASSSELPTGRYRIEKSQILFKFMTLCCERIGRAREHVSFIYKGSVILDEDTPEGLAMEEGDSILVDCMDDSVYIDVLGFDDDGVLKDACFSMKKHQPLGILMRYYCEHVGLTRDQVHFYFNHTWLSDENTPASLEMGREDFVKVSRF